VAEPPTEVGVVQQERGGQSSSEPRNADHDGEVGRPLGQEVGLQRSQDEQRVEEGSDDQGDHGRRTCRLGDGRNQTWHGHACDAEPEDAHERNDLKEEQGADAFRAPQPR
jgi:hypothetical protein